MCILSGELKVDLVQEISIIWIFSVAFQPQSRYLYWPMISHEIWIGSFVCLLVGSSAGPHADCKLWEVRVKVKESRLAVYLCLCGQQIV